MGIRQLSQEEVAVLRKNSYIENATANKIRFTGFFKEEFWTQYENGNYIAVMHFDVDGTMGMHANCE